MTYYDRIQNAIDYIETNLEEELETEDIAIKAFMSTATFYRLFYALTGFSVKQYIRTRRITNAVTELKTTTNSILEIALNNGFSSHASFTKAVKKCTTFTPNQFRNDSIKFELERLDIMDKYVNEIIKNQDYPDIKVLKEMKPVRVAYYKYFGKDPEDNAFKIMGEWFIKSGLDIEKDKIRVFGFDNPGPSKENQREYGYEVWVTISEDTVVEDELVKAKVFKGGQYAVTGVQGLIPGTGGKAIGDAWKRLNAWIKISNYNYGEHQWLEEHIGFNEEFIHNGSMDLYMPIKKT